MLGQRSSNGLTLVELLVVLAIIGTLLSVGGYGLMNYRQGEVWRQQVAAIEGLLVTGSQIARSSGRPVELIATNDKLYLAQEGQPLSSAAPHLRMRLRGNLQAQGQSTGRILLWRPSGRVEGAQSLYLEYAGRSRTFMISPWGEVR